MVKIINIQVWKTNKYNHQLHVNKIRYFFLKLNQVNKEYKK